MQKNAAEWRKRSFIGRIWFIGKLQLQQSAIFLLLSISAISHFFLSSFLNLVTLNTVPALLYFHPKMSCSSYISIPETTKPPKGRYFAIKKVIIVQANILFSNKTTTELTRKTNPFSPYSLYISSFLRLSSSAAAARARKSHFLFYWVVLKPGAWDPNEKGAAVKTRSKDLKSCEKN